jgi:hypothetical protein
VNAYHALAAVDGATLASRRKAAVEAQEVDARAPMQLILRGLLHGRVSITRQECNSDKDDLQTGLHHVARPPHTRTHGSFDGDGCWAGSVLEHSAKTLCNLFWHAPPQAGAATGVSPAVPGLSTRHRPGDAEAPVHTRPLVPVRKDQGHHRAHLLYNPRLSGLPLTHSTSSNAQAWTCMVNALVL